MKKFVESLSDYFASVDDMGVYEFIERVKLERVDMAKVKQLLSQSD